MRKGFFDRRIPTVFAIFILLGGLAITSLLITQGTFTTSKASPQEEPQNVRIVNITEDSFTVMFTTNSPTVGAISIENTSPPRLAYDKRDSSGQKTFVSHFVTITDLKPKTDYKFNIISNGDLYLDQGKSYSALTAPITAIKAPNTFPLAGSVTLPNATPGNDVLIYVSVPEGATAGAITDAQGNYRIPANYIRTGTTFEPFTLAAESQIKIEARKSNDISEITYVYHPGEIIPPITLSQNYSFIANEKNDVSTDTTSLLSLPTTALNAPGQLEIMLPQKDQTFTDPRPQFRGSATPNALVRIVIGESQNIEAQVRSDRNGNWAFRPSTIVLPGKHTITVQSKNAAGTLKSVSTSFQVFASGSQIADSATPSATLVPTRTPSPTVTIPPPTAALTQTPTVVISPTVITTVSPTTAFVTATLTPTIISSTLPTTAIPPKASIPATGSTTTTLILTTLSILFIVTGSAFLFIL